MNKINLLSFIFCSFAANALNAETEEPKIDTINVAFYGINFEVPREKAGDLIESLFSFFSLFSEGPTLPYQFPLPLEQSPHAIALSLEKNNVEWVRELRKKNEKILEREATDGSEEAHPAAITFLEAIIHPTKTGKYALIQWIDNILGQTANATPASYDAEGMTHLLNLWIIELLYTLNHLATSPHILCIKQSQELLQKTERVFQAALHKVKNLQDTSKPSPEVWHLIQQQLEHLLENTQHLIGLQSSSPCGLAPHLIKEYFNEKNPELLHFLHENNILEVFMTTTKLSIKYELETHELTECEWNLRESLAELEAITYNQQENSEYHALWKAHLDELLQAVEAEKLRRENKAIPSPHNETPLPVQESTEGLSEIMAQTNAIVSESIEAVDIHADATKTEAPDTENCVFKEPAQTLTHPETEPEGHVESASLWSQFSEIVANAYRELI
jgi:hypothetical protein